MFIASLPWGSGAVELLLYLCYHTSRELWAVGLLQCTVARLPGRSGEWDSFSALLPDCWGVVGSGTPSVHYHTAGEQYCYTVGVQWAVGLLQCTATLLGSSEHWDSFIALPHCGGAPGGGTAPVHYCHTAREQWVVGLLQSTATPLGSSLLWCGVACRRRCYQKAMAGMSTHGYR